MITLHNTMPVLFAAGTLLLVANAVWGFRDGRSRGRSGILVAMLVVWVFPLGVVLWLLFRPELVEEVTRPSDPDHELKLRANSGTL